MADLFSTIFNENRSKINTVLIGLLLIVGSFWLYSNFTKTEEVTNEEIKVEQGSQENSENSEGVVAGDQTGPGIGGGTEIAMIWVARDISKDSLKGGSYTVQEGDTLWEIAEGRYGSGFEWHKILDANKDKVGFLADGSQALIRIGDTLNLP